MKEFGPMLKKAKDFIEFNRDGAIGRMYCKICGTPIAGTVVGPKGPDQRLVEKFMRFPVYAEMKMECSDGSFHVTHGCKDCFLKKQPLSVLRELYMSDMEEMGMRVNAEPIKVVAIDTTGAGIV